MEVEFAEELKEKLSPEKTGLYTAATYVPSQQLLKNYMNRSYGNDYEFDQSEKIEGIF